MQKTRRSANFGPQCAQLAVLALALILVGMPLSINADEDHRDAVAVEIKVTGNRLTDYEGRSVRLIGVSRDGSRDPEGLSADALLGDEHDTVHAFLRAME
jgi:hypothetical protein